MKFKEVLNKYLKEDEAFARVISDTFVMFKRHTSIPQQSSTFNSISLSGLRTAMEYLSLWRIIMPSITA